jgi:6-phosphogluconolactonase
MRAIIFFLIVLSCCVSVRAADPDQNKDTLVYVGTYTQKESKGIYLFRLQTTGLEVSQNITLVPLGLAAETPSPSFLALDIKRRLLLAVK